MHRVQFQIDVRSTGTEKSLSGYPKYATDQNRADLLAEQAAREIQTTNKPGEYLVLVSVDGKAPVSSQLVLVPENLVRDASSVAKVPFYSEP